MDAEAARDAFERALAEQKPEFGQFFLALFFGLEISYGEDVCIVAAGAGGHMFNPQGSLHGGVIAFMMDVSMGHLVHHVTGRAGTTLEMKTQYLRALPEGRLRCEGRFLRRGRSLSFMESRMWDAEERLAAVTTATWLMPRDAPAPGSGSIGRSPVRFGHE